MSAPSADAQIIRPRDMIATMAAYGCTQPKDKAPSEGNLMPGGAQGTIKSLAGEVTGDVMQVRRLDARASGSGHVHAAIGVGTCEYSTALTGDAYLAEAGAYGAVAEFTIPALSFGGIASDRFLGSIAPYAGASAARATAYDGLVPVSRDVWLGATTRLHVPVTIFGANVMFYPTLSLQGDWAWDASIRATRGSDVVPHYSFMLPLPLDRFNLVGLAYSYDRIERFAGDGALTRHAVSLSHAKEKDVLFRVSVSGSVEFLADRRLNQQVAIVVSTKPLIF